MTFCGVYFLTFFLYSKKSILNKQSFKQSFKLKTDTHTTNKITKNGLFQYPVSRIGEHDCENFFSEKVEKLFDQIASHDAAKTVSDDSDVFGRALDEKDEKKSTFNYRLLKYD